MLRKLFFLFLALFMSVCAFAVPSSAKPLAKAPVILTSADETAPLSFEPLLSWSMDINAVSYEIEFFTEKPKKLNKKKPHKKAAYRNIYIYRNEAIIKLDFADNKSEEIVPLWWRVRSLDENKKPVSQFSELAKIFVAKSVPRIDAPIARAPKDNEPFLLYPVYSWIGQEGTTSHEVELYDTLPASDTVAPLWKGISTYCEKYDDLPRMKDTPFYWRVRSFDDKGNQVGNWSEFAAFTFPHRKASVAVFGDSISHGGGHLSFGPNTKELSWLTYLDFPALNLSESGDLTQDMVARFERDVLPFAPDYLFILGGSNDIRGETTADETIKNLALLYVKCIEHNIRPIFLTIPPINPKNIKSAFNEAAAPDWNEKRRKCNDFIRTLPRVVDIAEAFKEAGSDKTLKTSFALDGLHPDANGKKLIADCVNKNKNRFGIH